MQRHYHFLLYWTESATLANLNFPVLWICLPYFSLKTLQTTMLLIYLKDIGQHILSLMMIFRLSKVMPVFNLVTDNYPLYPIHFVSGNSTSGPCRTSCSSEIGWGRLDWSQVLIPWCWRGKLIPCVLLHCFLEIGKFNHFLSVKRCWIKSEYWTSSDIQITLNCSLTFPYN